MNRKHALFLALTVAPALGLACEIGAHDPETGYYVTYAANDADCTQGNWGWTLTDAVLATSGQRLPDACTLPGGPPCNWCGGLYWQHDTINLVDGGTVGLVTCYGQMPGLDEISKGGFQ